MLNAIEITKTSIDYPGLSDNQIIFAKTSLAPLPDKSLNKNSSEILPAEYEKYINSQSLLWLNNQKIPVKNLVLAEQVHGNKVEYVSKPGIYQNLDGFYTDYPKIYLLIRTADCAAVFVSIPEIPAVGIAHVGWRGARANIVGNLIKKMMRRWNADPTLLRIAVSPHIRNCCYSVGEEFNEYFQPQYLQRHKSQLYLILENVIMDQLLEFGIEKQNINISTECTSCSSLPLYSYRAQQKTKNRLLSMIAIP